MEVTYNPAGQEKNVPLTFGSIFSLSSITNLDSFVYVDGFVKDKVTAKKFGENNSKFLYSKCLFQLYPTLINTNKKKALRIKNNEDPNTKKNVEQRRVQDLTVLQQNLVTEFKINYENFKKVAGQPVSFGQAVQFLHIASNKFLSYRHTEAELEKQNYKVGLDEYSNDATMFRFMPCYKHQKDSEGTIFVSDSVYIASIHATLNKIPYLHISNPIVVNNKRQRPGASNTEKFMVMALNKPEYQKKKIKTEVNISLETQTRMKINYYSTYADTENNFLECGDIVWLNHSELAATLVAVKQLKSDGWTYKIEFDGNRITDQFKQFIGNTNGMWVIENEKFNVGGYVQWNESYRFKHLGSGLYLTVRKTRGKDEQQAEYRIILDLEASEDSEFMFVPVASTLPKGSLSKQLVSRDAFALIVHKRTKLVVHGNYEKQQVLNGSEGVEGEASAFGVIKPFLLDYSTVSEQAAFKVIQANYNEVWETNFLISCFPLLKSFYENMTLINKKDFVDKLTIAQITTKLEATLQCIKDLDSFCNNKQFNTSPDQKYGEVNPFRQKLLREQFFVDILVLILKEIISKKEMEAFETYKGSKFGDASIQLVFQGGTFVNPAEKPQEVVSKGPILGEYAKKYLEPVELDKKKAAKDNLSLIKKKVLMCNYIYSLLKSICKSNHENEIYTFNLIPEFLIHCKYIPEAVECVVSILQDNEILLTKLSENVKLDIDSTIDERATTNIINIIINIKDDEDHTVKSLDGPQANLISDSDKKSKISKPVNLINFFLSLLRGTKNKKANTHILTFFRHICCKNRTGLTINQDLLYKIFNFNPKFMRNFMIGFKCDKNQVSNQSENQIQVDFPTNWTNDLETQSVSVAECYKHKSSQVAIYIQFLEEQLNLYSDLALSRNYLWRLYLEERFPPSIVFNIIWNKRLPKTLRAAMCRLASSVYIDHEPFDPLNLPKMCRVYQTDYEKSASLNLNIDVRNLFLDENEDRPVAENRVNSSPPLFQLIDRIIEYLEIEVNEIASHLDKATIKRLDKKMTKSSSRNIDKKATNMQSSTLVLEDALNDALLLNVTQLFSKLISFNTLKLTHKENQLYQVVSIFIRMLEYDPKHPSHCILLRKLRESNIAQKRENLKKNTLSISGLKNAVGSVVDNIAEITETIGDILHITQQKVGEESKAGNIMELDEQNMYNNPTMRSMLSLHNHLERLKYDEDDAKDKVDIKLKLEICDVLEFLLDMRNNYLITNFLAWFRTFEDKARKGLDPEEAFKKVAKSILKSFLSTLPPIAKTGMLDLDEEFTPKVNNSTVSQLYQAMCYGIKKKKVFKYKDFIKNAMNHPDYIPDLDTLLLGQFTKENITADVLPSLLITFLNTKDTELESRLLDIIMKLFDQRTELFNSLNKLEILFDPAEKRSYSFIEKKSDKLKGLTERLEVWLGRFIENKGGDSELKEVEEILDQLTLLLDTYNSVNENDSMNIVNNNVKNLNQSRQNIMKYLETYKPILTICKNGMYTLNKVILDESVDVERKRILVGFFSKAHFFLQQFCKNNATIQSILVKHNHILLEYARIDVGQIDLLCAIYEGNRTLCENVSDNFLKRFIYLIENEGRQARFLKMFKVIQKVDKSYITENQIRVLRTLINNDQADSERLAMTLYAAYDAAEHEFIFDFDDYLSLDTGSDFITRLANNGFKDTYSDQPFTYHLELIGVLIHTIKGAESFNMSKAKLKSLFSLSNLLELLTSQDSMTSVDTPNFIYEAEGEELQMNLDNVMKLQTIRNMLKEPSLKKKITVAKNAAQGIIEQKAKGFSIIKSSLVDFVSELYINETSKLDDNIAQNPKCLDVLIEKEIKRLESINEETVFEPEYYEYFFKSILTLLNCYASKFLNDTKRISEFTHGKQDNLFYKFVNQLIKGLPNFYESLTDEQWNILYKFLENHAKGNNQEYEEDLRMCLKRRQSQNLREATIPSPTKEGNSPRKKQNSWATKENWDKVMKLFDSTNLKWKEALDQEKIALSKAVVRFSDLFPDKDKDEYRVTLDSKDIIKKLIKYLQYGFANKSKKKTIICTLKTLKKMMDKEDPKERQRLQNMLDSYDATKMILTVLSDSSSEAMDSEIFNHFLELGIELLEGGNIKVQKTIYNYFITFQRSEVLFAKFHRIITEHSNNLKKSSLKNKNNGDALHDAPTEEPSQISLVLLENVLRLLQLFTEGHNLDLQNYIRHQTNSRNNYDMVTAVTELLRAYLSHMNESNYESIMKCLSTLAEFVQGPCPENQMSLIDGKFFEFANFILSRAKSSSFVPIKHQKGTNMDLTTLRANLDMEKWMIARLRYRTLVLVLSLLEMRRDSSVVKRIMRSLPADILKNTLANTWKKYKKMYGTAYVAEALKHYEGDPKVKLKFKGKDRYNYYELITETGFAAFFLLEHYYETNEFDVDRDVVNEVMMKKMQSNTKKDNLLQASIVGQFGSFGVSFIKEGLDVASLLKNQLNKNLLKIVAVGTNTDKDDFLKEIEKKKLVREGLKFFAENSAHIEIMRNKRSEKIYFHLPPYSHFLPKEIKNSFNDTVDRSSVQTKASGLVHSSDETIRIMQHEQRLANFFNKNKFIALFAKHVNLWKDLAFTVALVVNFFILSSYSNTFGEEDESPMEQRLWHPRFLLHEENTWTENVMRLLGIIMEVASMFVVVFFMLKKMPLIITKIWQENPQEAVKKKKKKKGVIVRLLKFLSKVVETIIQLLMTPTIVYYLAYGTFAVLGVVIHPFFLTFHLTEILIRYPTLKDVIRAFWDPRKALALTFVLFVIMEYFFSLIAYVYLYDSYKGNCESTLACFLYTFDYTFKSNGGIGGQLEDLSPRDVGKTDLPRFFFDNTCNIIIVIIVINIVAGIIIDTFGSLREKDKERDMDVQEICFSCGCDKETYDRKSDVKGGFIRHIKIDHYMWNYVHYIAYLKEKDPTDYTGVESYIHSKLKEADVSWFPSHKTLILENADNQEDRQDEKLEYIDGTVQESKKVVKNLSYTLGMVRKKLGLGQK